MAKRKPKIKLSTRDPRVGSCSVVKITGMYADNPIGKICRKADGYTYHSFPIMTTPRGPVRTKARAILAVVRDYRIWIGLAPGQLKY